MRNFEAALKFNAAIITGRTVSYLIPDKDVSDSFNSIHKNLDDLGIVCFDFIDAPNFIPFIDPLKKITHRAKDKNKKFQRDSYWSVNESQAGAFNWDSVYYEEMEPGALIKLAEDKATLRAFSRAEMTGFLQQTGFQIKEFIERPSYAFATIVIVAEKIN